MWVSCGCFSVGKQRVVMGTESKSRNRHRQAATAARQTGLVSVRVGLAGDTLRLQRLGLGRHSQPGHTQPVLLRSSRHSGAERSSQGTAPAPQPRAPPADFQRDSACRARLQSGGSAPVPSRYPWAPSAGRWRQGPGVPVALQEPGPRGLPPPRRAPLGQGGSRPLRATAGPGTGGQGPAGQRPVRPGPSRRGPSAPTAPHLLPRLLQPPQAVPQLPAVAPRRLDALPSLLQQEPRLGLGLHRRPRRAGGGAGPGGRGGA